MSNITRISTILFGILSLALSLAISACQPIQAPAPATTEVPPTAAVELTSSPVDITAAFVRDHSLYIQQGEVATAVEDCTSGCQVYYLTWSPDGERLAYFYSPAIAQGPVEVRVVDKAGNVQTVATDMGWITPPSWSPAGDELAYLVATDRYTVEADISLYSIEIWTAELAADGTAQDAHKRGEVGMAGDCGGGGRSESAKLYEVEGGLSYGGYQASILAWTAEDILLFSNNCTARGVGRFDLRNDSELTGYAGKLSSLSLNRTRARWVAIDEQNQLVEGTPAIVDYEAVATQALPELVAFGQQTGAIFYTVLTTTDRADLFDGSSELQQSISVSPYFEFTQPELHTLGNSVADTLLWDGEGYAFARIQEGADGALYFARVGDSKALYDAFEDDTLTVESADTLRPTVDVLRLLPGNATPELWLANTSQFTLAPISIP